MGFSLSWIAARGHSPQVVRAAIGLRPTGRHEDFPESHISAAQLPNGLYLVVFDRQELTSSQLSQYSSKFDLFCGFVEEHVMCSSVAEWQRGIELWSVIHDAQKGILNLEVKGIPPANLAAIRDGLFAEQKDEDPQQPEVDHIFDIAVELAKELTGYRYDRDIEGVGSGAFEILEFIKRSAFSKLNPFRK